MAYIFLLTAFEDFERKIYVWYALGMGVCQNGINMEKKGQPGIILHRRG